MFKKENKGDNAENTLPADDQNKVEEIQNEGKISEEKEKSETKGNTENLQAKVDELNDKYLRLYSEFDNYRKRTAREKIELMKSAGEDIFKTLLPVLDDFERAFKSFNENTSAKEIKEGVSLVYQKLKRNMEQKGVEEMKSKGEAFDPDIHEAITNVPAGSEDQKGKVVEEIEKGYLLNGKVIRHAKVIVAS